MMTVYSMQWNTVTSIGHIVLIFNFKTVLLFHNNVRPECCDVVLGPGLRPRSRPGQQHWGSADWVSPWAHTTYHPCHSEPVRHSQSVSALSPSQCQALSVSLSPLLNQSCELYHRPVHRQNSPKTRVEIIWEIRVVRPLQTFKKRPKYHFSVESIFLNTWN